MTNLAANTSLRIDGTHWAGSLAINAFLSLFSLIILIRRLASLLLDRESAGRAIVTYLEGSVPLDGEIPAPLFTSLQPLHDASNGYAVLVICQNIDAAGKDGAIRQVMSGVTGRVAAAAGAK